MTATSPTTTTPVRVLVCDDHVVFRRGLALVLEPEGDLEVVGEAADTAAAVAAVAELAPHVVLMDLRMPGGGGLEATRAIRAAHPEVKVVVLTVSDDDDDLFEAVKAGAVGYLLKEVSIEEVGDAVRTVAAGHSLLSPAMTAKLLGSYADLANQASGLPHAGPIGDLTDRELEALRGIARGLSNRAIAAELGIAENTVKNHVRGVLEKLHVSSRTEAALYAVRQGLTEA
ncbi:response regulator transcription factor [Aquihabitans sp. G128]|uniref:response regulator n=1 Tax=Aquihabitans sp. G128 TaxID=2849779 RepID=UPI001C23D7C1|nr:response regulator transcription factor [Aquihabitans sp. G128]QXC62794.1 response regulator transcription factor [Aquihabitans sp. G128]